MEDEIGMKFLDTGSFNTFTMTMATLAVILVIVMLCTNVFLRIWTLLSGRSSDPNNPQVVQQIKQLFLPLEYSIPSSASQNPFLKGYLRSLSGHEALLVVTGLAQGVLKKSLTMHLHLGPYVEHDFNETVSLQGKVIWYQKIRGDENSDLVRIRFNEKEWTKSDLLRLIQALSGAK